MDFEKFTVLDLLERTYSFAMLQEFTQIRNYLIENDVDLDDLKKYIEVKVQLLAQCRDRQNGAELDAVKEANRIGKHPVCSVCGLPVAFQELNRTPCTVVPKFRTMYYCPDKDCISETQFSKKTLIELLKHFRIITRTTKRADRKGRSPCGSIPSESDSMAQVRGDRRPGRDCKSCK